LLPELPAQGRDFIIAGIVGSQRRLTTRDGRGFIAAEVQDLSGTLEVTVWPDVYDLTGELWLSGSILLMKVRVRERGDRLTAGVQEVIGFTPDFEVPFWATPEALADSAPPRRNGPSTSSGRANGNGGNGGNGHTNGAPAIAAPEAVEAAPEPPPAFDEAPPEDEPPLDEPSIIAESRAAYEASPPAVALHLELRETEDEPADQKRLTSLFRLLQAQPGTDRVMLTIRTRDGEAIELALPSAKIDQALRTSLQAAVGEVASVG